MKRRLAISVKSEKRTMYLAEPKSTIYVQFPPCDIEVDVEETEGELRAFYAHIGGHEVELCGGQHSRNSRIVAATDEELKRKVLDHFYLTATNADSALGRWLKTLVTKTGT